MKSPPIPARASRPAPPRLRSLAAAALALGLCLTAARAAPAPATPAVPGPATQSAPGSGSSRALAGESIAVQDGDSFVLRTPDGRKLRIRIAGIDAPEKGQPFSDVSRRHLAELLRERELSLDVQKVDMYGRSVARVMDGEVDVGLAQLRAGMAWFFRRYESEQSREDRIAYSLAESSAREAGLGLWRDADPQPPWVFRRQRRAP